ncbi:MAG: chorismate dehydratase [Verrucomicrobiota bacterium]
MSLDDLSNLRLAKAESAEDLARRIARDRLATSRQHERELEEAVLPPRRVGSVKYLNAVPLTRGLEDQIVFATPSELAAMLRAGDLDAALVSVTEVLFNDCYDVLDGIAVASLGEVRSVFLAHRVALDQIRQVFCDTASLTSVNLLKVLMAERGLTPELVPLRDYADAAGQDAVLLIGDPAIDFLRASHGHTIWDLGVAWNELTRLPFVYAVWALRRGVETGALRHILREARTFGLETLDDIIQSRREYDLEFRRDYLGWNIHYHLGEDEKRGLSKFIDLLRKHGAAQVFEPGYVV